MSALRFSGAVRVRLTYVDPSPADAFADGTPRHPNGSYRCTLTHVVRGATLAAIVGAPYLPEAKGRHSVIVGAPRSLAHAVDAPEAFDDTARAALAFASHEDPSWGEAAAYAADGSGYHVGRSLAKAWDTSESREVCRFCMARPVPAKRRTCGSAVCTSAHLAEAKAAALASAPATWADGFGRWHARVSRAAASPLLAARKAIRAALRERDPNVAPHAWRDLVRVDSLDTPETVVYAERVDVDANEVHS